MPQTYFVIPTEAGAAKLANAQALGIPLRFTHMSVGDGNGVLPVPDRKRSLLVNERRRAPLNQITQDPNNAAQIIAEQVIPENEGGWWVRELGLHDETGTLCYIGNCPETYKPQLAEGSGRTQVVRMVCLVTDGVTVELKIDPSVVLATRSYVDTAIAVELDKRDGKQSVLAATVVPLAALAGLQTVDGVALVAGARVLVKDQVGGKDNGIYVAAAGNWARSSDADTGGDLSSGALVVVEQGDTNGDALYQLVTDGVITIGVTPLAFQRVGAGYFAPLVSPAFGGAPTVPTAPPGTNNLQVSNTAFVGTAIANAVAALLNGSPAQLDTLKELADALGGDANFSATVLQKIAEKAALAGSAAQQFSVARATSPEHAPQLSQLGHGQCRLSVVNPMQIKLSPFDGNNLTIGGVPCKIPTAGVPITNATLAANTEYYVFAFMNGTDMALEFVAKAAGITVRMTDPDTGVQVKNGDASRTLVGGVITDALGQFKDNYDFLGCANWFNRRTRYVAFNSSGISFTNLAHAELSTTLRLTFWSWADEAVTGVMTGSLGQTVTGAATVVQLFMNSVPFGGVAQFSLAGQAVSSAPFASSASSNVPEGKNVSQCYASVTAGTGYLSAGTNCSITTQI